MRASQFNEKYTFAVRLRTLPANQKKRPGGALANNMGQGRWISSHEYNYWHQFGRCLELFELLSFMWLCEFTHTKTWSTATFNFHPASVQSEFKSWIWFCSVHDCSFYWFTHSLDWRKKRIAKKPKSISRDYASKNSGQISQFGWYVLQESGLHCDYLFLWAILRQT